MGTIAKIPRCGVPARHARRGVAVADAARRAYGMPESPDAALPPRA